MHKNEASEKLHKLKIFFRGYFTAHKMYHSLNAMNLVLKHHTGTRKDGTTPESYHMFEIVSFTISLLENKIPNEQLDNILAAAFLHDLPEDYPEEYSLEDVHKNFNDEIGLIVSAVTKPQNFNKKPEHYEIYFNQISLHPFSVFVKVADRINNMSTMLGVFSESGVIKYRDESQTYFIPMLKKAREDFPEYYMIFQAMKGTLQRQINFVNAYFNK